LKNWNASKSKDKVHMHYINYINNRPAGDTLPMGRSSQGCKGPNGHRPRGALHGFSAHKNLISAVHGDCCAVCGQSRDETQITFHHVKPIAIFHDNDIANILPVCDTCHKELHRAPAMFDNSLIRVTA
jgi:hypothetical protein